MHECRYGDALIIYIYNMHHAGMHWYQMHSTITLEGSHHNEQAGQHQRRQASYTTCLKVDVHDHHELSHASITRDFECIGWLKGR
jgi:hypothetical protein